MTADTNQHNKRLVGCRIAHIHNHCTNSSIPKQSIYFRNFIENILKNVYTERSMKILLMYFEINK